MGFAQSPRLYRGCPFIFSWPACIKLDGSIVEAAVSSLTEVLSKDIKKKHTHTRFVVSFDLFNDAKKHPY